MKIQARCGQKDPRKPSAENGAVIMAYLRSKSSAKRVKASVGSKTRSAEQHFYCEKSHKVYMKYTYKTLLFLSISVI